MQCVRYFHRKGGSRTAPTFVFLVYLVVKNAFYLTYAFLVTNSDILNRILVPLYEHWDHCSAVGIAI